MKKQFSILQFNQGTGPNELKDWVAEERPLTIFLNGSELVTLLCSPDHLEELALGYLVSEGLIGTDYSYDLQADHEQGLVALEIPDSQLSPLKGWGKRTITTGCGRGTSFYELNDRRTLEPLTFFRTYHLDQILENMKVFLGQSGIFQKTGGVHRAGLCLRSGLVWREDVGRHNAVDKLMGYCALNKIKTDGAILFLSGRISSEIVIKAARQAIPLLVSRSAPTSLAIQLAEELGLTLVGFARGNRANVYSHASRIQ